MTIAKPLSSPHEVVFSNTLVRDFLAATTPNDDPEPETWARAILSDAHRERATDVHIDPHRRGARIRLRIDGTLQEAAHVPAELAQQLINQLKVMARLDPIVSELPLESRWRHEVGDEALDVRLTTIACHGGEKLHARLLDRGRLGLSVDSLGLSATQKRDIEQWQNERDGMLLVTGPTGAGKTTTLYSIVSQFVDGNQNVLTIEDPVEYALDGATQIQVDEPHSLDFAQGIRAMLRLDPDVMLVGELRDDESAQTAMKAAASGHTVLSTLHAGDAVGAVNTMRQWGIKNGPLSTLLSVVINQRLVGRLCSECRTQRDLNSVERAWFESSNLELPQSGWIALGCSDCNQSGIRGRIGIYELWKLSDEDRKQIANDVHSRDLASALRDRGHECLASDVHRKFVAGQIALPITE